MGAVVRTAARSFDERARGLTASSASPGAMALLAISWKLDGAPAATGGRWREPPGVRPARSARKFLTMRSSSEWKVTTARRPPGFSIALGGGETGLQLFQLLVDRDAQPLERAGGRMDLGALAAAQGALDHVGQVQGAVERRSSRRLTRKLAMRREACSSP
jgi:hypothetical protein